MQIRPAKPLKAIKLRDEDFAEPEHRSVLQRWRARRDLVLYVAWVAGMSQRALADVFDLPPSRVCQITKRLRARLAR